MSKIKIEFVEEFGIGEDTRATVELEGDGSSDHWLKAIVGAMTLAGYDQQTIMEMLDPCDRGCGSFGGTCCDDEPSVMGAGVAPLPPAPKMADYVHPDKVVESLHGDDIASR